MNYQELQEAKQTFRLHAIEKDMKPLFKVREDFIRRFSPAKIASMKIDDYVIGRQSKISFCYELERKLDQLGRITGQPSSKFGIWYSPQIGDYKLLLSAKIMKIFSETLFPRTADIVEA